MTTYKTQTESYATTGADIPVVHEENNRSGLLAGAAVLTLGALAVVAGAALLGDDDDYDQVAAYDENAAFVSADLDDEDAYILSDDDTDADAAYVTDTTYVTDADDSPYVGTMEMDADADETVMTAETDGDDDMIAETDIEVAMNDDADYNATVYAGADQTRIEYSTTPDAEPKTAVMGALETTHPKYNDTVGEILQADGEPSIQSDEDIIVMDDTVNEDVFRAADDDGMVADNAIVVPGSNGTLTTVTCPAGTTAQTDMTCEITGEYKPDLED
ncbi:MAG: hypothetical protein WBG08_11720 [Litorimonas sp.]